MIDRNDGGAGNILIRQVMMKVTWIGGATVVIQVNGLKIVCDPVLCKKGTIQDYRYFKSTRLNNPEYDKEILQNIDVLLITHFHSDHFDDIAKSVVTSNIAVANEYKDKINTNTQITLQNNESFTETLKDTKIIITAVAAVHGRNKIIGHLVGKNTGYVIELENQNKRYVIYITGDDVFKKQKQQLAGLPIDLIIANTGSAAVGRGLLSRVLGRITNNQRDVLRLNRAYKPKYLLPVHFGTFSHYQEKNYSKESLGTNVLLMSPGESVEI